METRRGKWSLLLLVALAPLLFASCSVQPSTAEAEEPVAPAVAAAQSAETVAAEGDSGARLRAGEDWPWFLGPRHDGTSAESELLETWPEDGPPLVWEMETGTGYTAPSVRGHRLVLFHRREGIDPESGEKIGFEVIECLHAATGDSLWTYRYPTAFQDPYGYNNGPRCTPLLTETHCYTFGAEGKLACITLDEGREVWKRDLHAEMDIPDGFFGVGATPILEDDILIVAAGGQPNSGVIGVDAATGKTLWENVGKSTWDGAKTDSRLRPTYEWTGEEMVVSYSSPIAATIHGKRHVLCLMRQGLVSLDPKTGEEYFHYWFSSDSYESVNAARPVVVDDTIMLSAAYKVGSVLLRVAEDGKSVTEVWRDKRNLLTHWSTAIHHEGYYYGFSGRHDYEATLRSIDAETGEVVMQTDGWGRPFTDLRQVGRDQYRDVVNNTIIPTPFYGRGSKIQTGDRFIVLSEFGLLALVEATPDKWEEVCRFKPPQMHYPSWTAPVLSRGYLYLRCEDVLLCYDLRPPGS
ncbi:MAG: hypothetical protein DWQ34_20670 [Planctomycetota bacterium]|nr:MAG: hypothetical protein DWQ34_20670 [Planctomycetota bacterium]REK25241.1 MAG: hypothetical protein DWQ41_12475 [Planctomycetota bacterium]REK32120.1 MAG: hypothetical protein DWQ45_17915 [Planctomycetota bacterium]